MKKLPYYLLFLFLVLTLTSCGGRNEYDPSRPFPIEKPNIYHPDVTIDTSTLERSDSKVDYVTDGDTIKVYINDERISIRLIGIDSFESRKNNKAYRQAYEYNLTIEQVIDRGKKAKDYLKKLVENKKYVYLEYDKDKIDRYKRTLAYVWLQDNQMLNMTIICSGFAIPLKIDPNNKYADIFQKCYEDAKRDGLGLWKQKRY
jgi:micrococcal nuclease